MKKTPVLAVKLFIIAAISALVLGFGNKITSPVIEARQDEEFKQAYSVAYPDGEEFESIEEDVNDNITEIIEVSDGSNQVGYVFKGVAKGGFNGDIDFIMGVDNSGIVQGFKALNHGETPSYGSRIEEDEFVDGVVGVNIAKGVSFGAGDKDNGEIHGISGATVTTTAMTNGFHSIAMKMSELSDEIGPLEAVKPDTYAKYYEELFPEGNKFLDLLDEEGKVLNEEAVKIVDVFNNDEHLGKILQLVAKGYGGDINLLLSLDTHNIITNMKIASHGETPDLGDGIETEAYLNNIVGKDLSNPVKIRSNPKKDNHILLLSSATVTSKGMEEAFNAGHLALKKTGSNLGTEELNIEELISEESREDASPKINYIEAFEDIDEIIEIENDEATNDKVWNIVGAKKEGKDYGYVFDIKTVGFAKKTPINFAILVSQEGKIEDIRIIEHAESPDYGDGIEKDNFLESIVGKDLNKLSEFKSKSKPSGDNEIQAVSEATYTTDAMVEALDKAIESFKALSK